MGINRLYISKSRYLCNLFHSSVPHFERNGFDRFLLFGDFNSTNFNTNCGFLIESHFLVSVLLRGHTDLLSKRRLTKVESKDERSSSNLRRAVS